jgi:hypothetical protein
MIKYIALENRLSVIRKALKLGLLMVVVLIVATLPSSMPTLETRTYTEIKDLATSYRTIVTSYQKFSATTCTITQAKTKTIEKVPGAIVGEWPYLIVWGEGVAYKVITRTITFTETYTTTIMTIFGTTETHVLPREISMNEKVLHEEKISWNYGIIIGLLMILLSIFFSLIYVMKHSSKSKIGQRLFRGA